MEDEADAVVAVGVPVAVFVAFRGDAVDDEVAGVVMVEASDDVEQGGLTRARRPQDRDELVVAEGNRDVVERDLREVAGGVGLADVLELEHGRSSMVAG